MEKNLQGIKVCFCEPNGDSIFEYAIDNALTALVPNVGDRVDLDIDGTYREVTERAFSYGPRTIIVLVYLKEVKEPQKTYSFE
ncbi:hypothetical protein A0U40_05325 [[Bacillus] sp. KCTC 13219]|nr:hypothetical protein A0U40_05325 [[Bacillus] sp. KCTC 13219]